MRIEQSRTESPGRPAAAPGLPFPRFHLTFHRPLPPGTTTEAVLDAVEGALRRGHARSVRRGVDRIDFVGASPNLGATTFLGHAFGPGSVWIEREGEAFFVRYALGFDAVFQLWAVMAVLMVGFMWLAGEPGMMLVGLIFSAFPALAAIALTVMRVDTGLREAVHRAVARGDSRR